MWNRFPARNVRTMAKAGQELTPAFGLLLSPLAAMALGMGLWALLAQIAITANFPIAGGALADWRSWFLISATLEVLSYRFRSQTPDR
jgi:hypothetical protein